MYTLTSTVLTSDPRFNVMSKNPVTMAFGVKFNSSVHFMYKKLSNVKL